MGDGFLCSVGFPFAVQGSLLENSLALAESFISIFDNEAKKYFPDKNVYCGIGMAYGDVCGYFPKTGLKHYDLYGETIIKATRYEAMRKIIFEQGRVPQGNIMILQEDVFGNLASGYQDGFMEYQLDQYRVRDDPNAEKLYYKVVVNHFSEKDSKAA